MEPVFVQVDEIRFCSHLVIRELVQINPKYMLKQCRCLANCKQWSVLGKTKSFGIIILFASKAIDKSTRLGRSSEVVVGSTARFVVHTIHTHSSFTIHFHTV